MIAHLILGRRKGPYPAENPECLDVQTESGFVEAYARLGSLVEAYRKSGQFDAVGQLAIEIPDDAIQAALAPKREAVPVKVLS